MAENLEQMVSLIECARPEYEELQEAYRKWDEKWGNTHHFNLFADMTHGGALGEVDHSRILAKFLNPKTQYAEGKSAGPEFLNCFAKLLKVIKPEIEMPEFTEKAWVIREGEKAPEGIVPLGGERIDLYIEENNRCIIVENKITGKAPDQKNQTGRYFNSAVAAHKKVMAIVYLPLYEKQPQDDYEGVCPKEDYKKKLVILPALGDEGRCLVNGFIDECIKLTDDWGLDDGRYTAAVCLQQYAELIKRNGRKDKWAEDAKIKLLKKILSRPSSKEVVADIMASYAKIKLLENALSYPDVKEMVEDNIVDIWNNRHNLLAEEFKIVLKGKKFDEQEILGEPKLGKLMGNNIVLYFHHLSDFEYQIGFGCKTGNMDPVLISKLVQVLKDGQGVYLMPDALNIDDPSPDWVCSNIKFEKIKGGSLDETLANLVKYYEFLEKEAKKIIDADK